VGSHITESGLPDRLPTLDGNHKTGHRLRLVGALTHRLLDDVSALSVYAMKLTIRISSSGEGSGGAVAASGFVLLVPYMQIAIESAHRQGV